MADSSSPRDPHQPSLDEAIAWLDANCPPERLAELLQAEPFDEDEAVRVIAQAAAGGDEDARRWIFERRPEAVNRLLDEVNARGEQSQGSARADR